MKAFSVASQNVKHFKGKAARVDRVVEFLKAQEPDLFALYEVMGAEVFAELSSRFTRYTFQITEGPQAQEILVGVKSTITAFITQKLEFKAGSTYMRPGLLVTVTMDKLNYALLFLHLATVMTRGTWDCEMKCYTGRPNSVRNSIVWQEEKGRHTISFAAI